MILLYFATLIPFLLIDAVMLTTFLGPAFRAALGPMIAESPAWLPAGLFYLLYPVGLIALVTGPALRDGTPAWPRAAILGATAYGTYELTCWAVLAGYPAGLALFDIAWGTVLTTLTAILSLAITRRFGQM